MPTFAPLRPGDPERLGGLPLLGRLGEGGQGVVYLARDPAGTHVAVKWLRPDQAGDEVSVGRFLREVQVAQQVAPFCTAAVLGTGIEHDRPYIVSEFIEGPSLQKVVQEEGPRTGTSLHRLAIGTATALAAIHQAGIVHRDFKPANVIIGADGPRVIDFGIARALNATSTISSMPVGTPSYMPPEQVMGHTVGPAADLFSWGSTMVFAASGRSPFGSDTMPAVINRVLNHQPDLGVLQGPLLDVVAACLAKDPAQRPTAEQVIMRLLQHPVPNSGMLAQAAAAAAPAEPWRPQHSQPPVTGQLSGPPSPLGQPAMGSHHSQPSMPGGPSSMPGGPPSAPGHYGPPSMGGGQPSMPGGPPSMPGHHGQPLGGGHPPTNDHRSTRPNSYDPRYGPKKSRAPIVIGATVTVALLVLAGVAVIISQTRPPASLTPTDRVAASASARKPSATPTGVPRTGTKRQLPGGSISVYENAADPSTLTSYEVYNKKADDWIDYARNSLRGTFTKYSRNWESLVSPDGHSLAGRGRNYTSDNYDSVIITDRQSGEKTSIKTVRKPLISSIRAWSKDGSKILLNIEKETGKDWLYLGFVIVDVEAEDAKVVTVADTSVRKTAYGWDGDEEGVVNMSTGQGLRFFDTTGKATRTLANIGTLASGTQDIFSPSGKVFITNCPKGGDGDHCVWDARSGDRIRRFTSDCDKVLGWYDETHLYCWEQDNSVRDEIQVVDFKGKLVRKLLDIPENLDFSPVFTVNPGG
ncbi:protein kinase [Nonomuraea sp. NPDC049269]|uniref:protein kinase domain-containing protein n=1 Tax=Nonomuraea sp. NPDC049269 TaxID=3364349 RepID=UPI003714FBDC